jgi:hypothetical protein
MDYETINITFMFTKNCNMKQRSLQTIYSRSWHVAAALQTLGLPEYEVATAMLMDFSVFWARRQCISLNLNQSFGGANCLHHHCI